jgi:hypothetical protein
MPKPKPAIEFEFSELPRKVPRMPAAIEQGAWRLACANAREEMRWLGDGYEREKRKWLLSLIETLMDNFDRNLEGAQVDKNNAEAQRWLKRFRRQQRRLEEMLANEGAVPFDVRSAPPGLVTVEGEEERDDVPDGTVMKVFWRGWLWRGELLRKAAVVVAKNTGGDESHNQGPETKESGDA